MAEDRGRTPHIPRLDLKYRQPSPSAAQLSVPDSDDFQGKSSKALGSRDYSRAVAQAMRSLQEKIRHLDSENEGLRRRLVSLDQRYTQEREQWQRYAGHGGTTTVKSVTSPHESTQGDLKRALAAVEEYKEKLRIAESQLRVQQTEGRREQGQAVIEKEAYSLKLGRLSSRLETVEEEAKELRATNQRLEAARAVHHEEIVQAEKLIVSLKEELSYLRDHCDLQKSTLQSSFASSEAQLSSQIEEYKQKLRQLEVRNHSLTELSDNHKQQLDYLKKELTELQRLRSHDESATLQPKTKPSQLKLNRTRRSRLTQSRSRQQSHHSQESLEERAEIGRLQEAIATLNQQYRHLLETSSAVDLQTLRLELNSIAETLEDNTSQLIRLKRRHRAE